MMIKKFFFLIFLMTNIAYAQPSCRSKGPCDPRKPTGCGFGYIGYICVSGVLPPSNFFHFTGVCLNVRDMENKICHIPSSPVGFGGNLGNRGSGRSGDSSGVAPCFSSESPTVWMPSQDILSDRANATGRADLAGIGTGAPAASVLVHQPLASCGQESDGSIYFCSPGQVCCQPPVDGGRGQCGVPGCPVAKNAKKKTNRSLPQCPASCDLRSNDCVPCKGPFPRDPKKEYYTGSCYPRGGDMITAFKECEAKN
jgi:hypothetical protein